MDTFDLDFLRLPDALKRIPEGVKPLPRHKKGEKFLKGPIPWDWLSMASRISGKGKALHVANAIWVTAGIKKTRTITLSMKILRGMGVNRNAAYRGLDVLEDSGLVSVIRHRGRCPVVTINDFEDCKVKDGIPITAKQIEL